MANRNSNTALNRFRIIALIEGISMIVLVFIAMPLKYWADQPAPVKYVGWAHGILFLIYCISLLEVWIKYKWSFGKAVVAFIASLLPFGTFLFEKRLRKEERSKIVSPAK